MTKYLTIAGDTWDGVAYKTLGDAAYTDKLMKENLRFCHIVIFSSGITLSVPDIDSAVSVVLPPWKRRSS